MAACAPARAGLAIVALLGVAAPALAGEALPPVPYQNYQHVLPSGLRVVGYQLGGARMVSVAVSYLGGYLAEPPGKEGVAEIVMRLSSGLAGTGEGEGFGEARRPSIGQRLVAATSSFDGSVETNSLVFTARAPPNRLEAILELEAERLRDPLAGVGEEHFERARARLLDEVAGEERAPSRAAGKWDALGRMLPAALVHPRPATRESLQAITWEDVKAHAAATFRPERAIVAVVGPAAVRSMGLAAEHAFEPLQGGEREAVLPARREAAPAFPMPEPRALETFRGPVSRPRLWIAWLIPARRDADEPVAHASAFLIGTATLWAAAAGTARVPVPQVDRLDGFVLLSAAIDLENEEDAGKILSAVGRLSMPPWSPGPLGLVMEVGQLLVYRMLENLPASAVTEMVREGDGLDPIGDAQQRFLRPATEATWRTASAWVRREAAMAVLELPQAERPTVAGALGGAEDGRPAGEAPDPVPSWMNRLPPGRYDVYSMAQPPGLSGAWRDRLENGMEVVGYPRPGYPKIAARLVLSPMAKAAQALPALALGARAPRPPRAPPCRPIAPEIDPSAIVWSEDVPAGWLDRALDQLSCNVVEFQFDRGVFAKRRDREAERLGKGEKRTGKSALRATRAAAEAFDAGSPGRRPSTSDEVDDLSKGEAEEWVRAQLRPDRATLVLVGELPPQESVMVSLAPRFRNWKAPPGAPAPQPPSPPPAAPARRSLFAGDVPDLPRAQVFIQVRWRAGPAPDAPAEDVVVQEAERRTRREHRHGVRQVDVHRGTDPSNPYLHVHFEVRPDEAGVATRKVLEALGTVAEAPVLAENVEFWRWIMARRFPARFATVDGLAHGLVEQVERGFPADWWDRHPASIAGVSPARVEAAARRLAVGREVVLLLGPRDAIAASLAKEGLPVEKPGS
ncbi:MAG TPA: hypothetical protein VFM53_02930 [Anaeromyxobacteraceae bacterium]|nr:hypothetical protein [Anaeromyxobacteraceae bacterium]